MAWLEDSELISRRKRAMGRLSRASRNAGPRLVSGGILVWLMLAAGLLGSLVYLIAIQSPENIFKTATLPLLLLLLQLGVFTLRLPSRFGPVTILVAALFIPLTLPTGTASRIVDSLLLTMVFVGAWLIKSFILERRLSIRRSPVNTPLMIFMALTLIAWIWSQVFRDPLVVIWDTFPMVQAASTIVMIMLPASFLLMANTVEDEGTLRTMTYLFFIAGGLGLVKQFFADEVPVNVNGLFNMWIVCLAGSWALFYRESAWWVRAALGGIVVLWLVWGFGINASWLAGWLPAVVGLGVLAWRRSWRWLLVFLILAATAIVFNTDYLERTIEAEIQVSLLTRLDAYQQNWLVTREHLLLGTGPGGYAAYYISYFPTRAMATHNNYIDILAQTGILGLATFVWFLIVLLRVGVRVSRRLHGRGDFLEVIANAAYAGAVGAVVIAAFGDWLLPFTYTGGIVGFDHAVFSWLFMAAILVVDRLSQRQLATDDSGLDDVGT